MLLVLLAAVPLLVMALVSTWQNYRFIAARPAERVALARAVALARQEAIATATADILAVLATDPALGAEDRAACDARLGAALRASEARYANLWLFGADGALRCAAAPLPPTVAPDAVAAMAGDVLRRAAAAGRFTLGGFSADPVSGAPMIPAVLPLPGAGGAGGRGGFLVAATRIGGLMPPIPGVAGPQPVAAWLQSPGGRVIPLAGSGVAALPNARTLAALLRAPTVLRADARDGESFAYAAARLSRSLSLIIGYPAARDLARARHVLLNRIGQLIALLLIGLAATIVGANLVLLEPLNRLGAAVRQWRAGGSFDLGLRGRAPAEIRELAISFQRAILTLSRRERQLSDATKQQELLMREIHHRVKNNLQIVASLLNLQAARIRQPEAKAEFQSARDRVRALATLHRHLYSQGELHTINMRSFLGELTDQLFQAMGETAGRRISLEIEASELQMSSDQAVPLALIVTEAVSNALKYAFPAGRSGHVAVHLRVFEGEAELVVQDDGVGIPAGRVETETGTRDGIGIQLIRGFARQLGASLRVEEGEGTRYVIRLPLRRERDDAAEPMEREAAA